MNVFLIGFGGCEYVLVWVFVKFLKLIKLYVVFGNVGIVECVDFIDLDVLDYDVVISFCCDN